MMDQNETGTLIGSDKVEGTAVYGIDRNKIGSIERLMIDKSAAGFPMPCLASADFLGLETITIPCPGNP